jgi:hypothetical protein
MRTLEKEHTSIIEFDWRGWGTQGFSALIVLGGVYFSHEGSESYARERG